MEKAISYINVMPDTKAGIDLFVSKVLDEIEIREALPLLVKLTAMGKIIDGVKSGLKDQLIEEAALYSGEGTSFEVNGVRFTRTERKTYHYNHAEKWRKLNEQIKALEKLMQAGVEFADPETGEIITPATVSYTESISVTLNK